MAGFKPHITTSTLLGAAYGGAAHAMFDVPLPTCFLAGGLCSVSGMLPDLDSDSSRPLQEGVAFAAAVVPMMLVDRFQQFGWKPELMILAGAALYLFVRFALGEFLRRYTVHRGMFHSLPAALIFGQLAFLLSCGTDLRLRLYQAGAVVVGYLSHLVLDELYSIEWRRGRLRLKKSFGTGLKMFSHGWWPNISTYGKLAILTYIVVYEPGWMDQVRQGRHLDWAQNWVQEQTQNLAARPGPRADDRSAEHSTWGSLWSLLRGRDRDSRQDKSQPSQDRAEPKTAEQRARFLR